MIYDKIKLNQNVPLHETYNDILLAHNFWWNTYELPVNYIDSSDARGNPILPSHGCEDAEDYNQRKNLTKPKAYVQQIINQFNSFLFNSDIVRTGVPEEIINNANLRGESLNQVMSEACILSQVKGLSFLIPDSTLPSGNISMEQARLSSSRSFIKVIDPDAIINWSKNYDEVIILFDGFIRYMNDDFYQDFEIKINNRGNLKVIGIGEIISHNYDRIPLVMLRAKNWPDSQAAKLCDIFFSIINFESVLNIEIMNKTFSHHVFAGDFDADSVKNAKIGQGFATVLETKGGVTPTLQVLGGADISQADSIRASIKSSVNELYRTAGLSSPEPLTTSAPESGIAKLVEFNKTESIVKSLAEACESAENNLWELMGINATTDYPETFAPTIESESAIIDNNNN